MRGHELLDRMDLVMPEYVEAANTYHVSKGNYMIKIAVLVASMILFAGLLGSMFSYINGPVISGDRTESEGNTRAPVTYADIVVSARSIEELKENVDTPKLAIMDSTYLQFEKYSLRIADYVKYVDDEGEVMGDETFECFWHTKDCEKCMDTFCDVFRSHLIYIEDGVRLENAAPGYELKQAEEGEYYLKYINNNKVAFVVMISDHMYCRFVIDRGCEDFDVVFRQLFGYCVELKTYMEWESIKPVSRLCMEAVSLFMRTETAVIEC